MSDEISTPLTVTDAECYIRAIDPACYTPENLNILCGNGQIVISLKDGSVTLENCELPEAAVQFWEAVTNAFPSVAQGIAAHAKR